MKCRKAVWGLVLFIALISPGIVFGQETLAVLDFTTEAVSKTEMKAIVEYLSAELFNTGKFIVIDVSQRETILNEMEFSMSGCTDESCALEIGKLLSAETIVTGTLSKIGSRYLMSVKMLETETSKTLATSNGKYGDLDELIDGLENVAAELAGNPVTETVVESEPEKNETVSESASAEESDKGETTAEAAARPAAPADKTVAADNGGVDIPAIICTSAGAAGLCVGGYFLYNLFANSLPAFNTANIAYDSASYGSDFDTLFTALETSRDAAFNDFLIGSIAAGAGVVLTTVGIILFANDSAPETSNIAFSPVVGNNPGLLVRVSY